MRSIARFLVTVGLVVSLACAPGATAQSAAMFKGDPQLSGVVATASPPRALAGVRFRFKADGPIRSTPVYANGTVYFGSDDGHLYALDARSGAVRWTFAAGAGVSSSPSTAGGLVYFTAWDGGLYALDGATGKLRWKTRFGSDLGAMTYWDFYTSSPTLLGNTIYVGSGDGNLYAVDRLTGRTLWRHAVGARIRSTPAVTDSTVVVGTMDGHVVAVDRRTGAPRWTFATDGAGYNYERKHNDTTAVPASPAIRDGVVTIGARDGNLYAIDLATGAQRWKTTHDGGSWILSTAMLGTTVFSGSGSAAFIQSAKLADGTENWRAKISGAAFGAVTVAGDVLIGDDFGGNVRAIDTQSGRALWTFPLDDRIFGGGLIADGAVFVGADSGQFVALDTGTVAAPVADVKRLVYAQPNPGPDDFRWFQFDIDRTLFGTFAANGYDKADDAALIAAMTAQVAGKEKSVIVFADGNLPLAAGATGDQPSLVRRFIDAGGIAVFLGVNPLAFQYDDKGAIKNIDERLGFKALGLTPLERPTDFGYHVSRYTRDGERWGLSGEVVVNGAIDANQVTTVLASNRLGHATAWAKRYPGGGMALYLPIPRNRLGDVAAIRAAIDHAVALR